MDEVFLPSGRVSWHPMSEVPDDWEIRSLLSGRREQVRVARKVVDGTHLEPAIPLTHRRSFQVDAGVVCVPPNDLPLRAQQFSSFTSSAAESREGTVIRLEPGRMLLQGGPVASPAGTLHVDCTAAALARSRFDRTPVFRPGRIDLQLVRFPLVAQKAACMADPRVKAWLDACRLNPIAAMMQSIAPDDTDACARRDRLRELAPEAARNMQRLQERLFAGGMDRGAGDPRGG
jgi:hypothetical protein